MENFAPLTAATWRPEAWQAGASVPADPPSGQDFQSLLEQIHTAPTTTASSTHSAASSAPSAASSPAARAAVPAPAYTVRGGDSLNSIVQQLAREQGVQLSAEQTHRYALELAQSNRISDPNRIRPGQSLQTAGLFSNLPSGNVGSSVGSSVANTDVPAPKTATAAVQTQQWLAQRPVAGNRTPSTFSAPQLNRAIPHARTLPGNASAHPVLQQTLERAVARGFIPADEKSAVEGKILQLAQKYRFAPDDFARMTLMESDGMNPKASNQRCHGIIQFCDGPNRGAASVGMAQQPKAILGLSVYQQLHLVDTYFDEVKLGRQDGPTTLDDLYLTVLQPAARQEKQAHVPLNILGPQARALHVDADTRQPITRQSIVDGLLRHTREKLGQMFSPPPPARAAAAVQVSQTDVPGAQDKRVR